MENRIVQNWIELAKYDLETAGALLESNRDLHVPVYCQQAIEKILKAKFANDNNATPPYTHNIVKLAVKVGLFSDLSDSDKNLCEELGRYYIHTRYSEEIKKIKNEITSTKAKQIFEQTKRMVEWVQTRL